MTFTVMLVIIVILYVIGVPISISLGLGSAAYLAINGVAVDAICQKMFNGVDSTSLLCIPFFLIAGDFMARGGIGDRLIYLAKLMVGKLKGGLCYVTILACAFFAAITGTTSACVTAIGPMVIPAMEKEGYDRDFATSVCLAGSTLGPIIPPSLTFIVYATLTGASIKNLYLVGVPTGILIALGFCFYIFVNAKRRNFATSGLPTWKTMTDAEKKYRKKMLLESIWALGAPVLILVSIFGGICTPTEAAVLGAAYAILVSIFVFKQVKIKELPNMFMQSGKNTARIMFIIACATLFSFVLVYEQIPQTVMAALAGITSSKYVLILIMCIILFVMGMFMETTSIMLISVPIFLPLLNQFGIDLIHVGAIMAAFLAIGAITPPYGSLLFIGTFVGNVPLQKLFKRILPFVGVMVVVSLLVAFLPQLVMWIV